MTQVGCYTLHLYCDRGEECWRRRPENREVRDRPDEIIGETASECRKKARKRGWKLKGAYRDGDVCPECAESEEG